MNRLAGTLIIGWFLLVGGGLGLGIVWASPSDKNENYLESLDYEYHGINLKILAEIESSGFPAAYNRRTKAMGLFQITPIVLKQYRILHNEEGSLFDPAFNTRVAKYYIEWLSRYCDTIDEILIAWHDGIGNLWKYQKGKRKLGPEMKEFLRKYHEKSYIKTLRK